MRYAFLFFLVLLSSGTQKANAQNNPANIVESLNKVILPIATFQPDSSFQDISFLKETLKDKHIIGLGEATHGTHEFFKYKVRLIRYLVTHLDYKAIAFESDFVSLINLNRYINGQSDKMDFRGGFPMSSETKAMLEWLRAHNSTKQEGDRVQIYGLEIRGFNSVSELLLESLPNLSDLNRDLLLKFKNTAFNLLTKKDFQELKSIVPALYEVAKEQKRASLLTHYVRLLEQKLIEYTLPTFSVRDKHMYESAAWLYENSPNKKLIIWAHNGHLAKSNIFKQDPFGKLLCQKYADKYYVIATDFNHGEVGVYVKQGKEWRYKDVYYPEVLKDSGYEFFFSKAKYSNFFIDIKEASKDALLGDFLKNKRDMRSIGGTESPANSKLSIAACFDLVAFFNKTGASR